MFIEKTRTTPGGTINFGLAWSPDGRWLAACGAGSCVKRFSTEPILFQGPEPSVFSSHWPLDWIGWSRYGIVAFTRYFDRVLHWNPSNSHNTSAPIRMLMHTGAAITCAALSPDGRYLATGASGDPLTPHQALLLSSEQAAALDDNVFPHPCLRVWDLASDRPAQRVQEVPNLISCVHWLSDHLIVLSTTTVGAPILIIDTQTKQTVTQLPALLGSITALASKPHVSTLLVGAAENALIVYDLRTMCFCYQLELHDSRITSLALNDAGTHVITGSLDGSIVITAITPTYATVQQRLVAAHHQRPIRSIAWQPNSWVFASCGDDASICVWSATSTI